MTATTLSDEDPKEELRRCVMMTWKMLMYNFIRNGKCYLKSMGHGTVSTQIAFHEKKYLNS